jgi:rhodanese-related sulfurtransferase
MTRLSSWTRLAVLATISARRHSMAFTVRPSTFTPATGSRMSGGSIGRMYDRHVFTRLFGSPGSGITDITKEDMEEVLEDFEQGGREDSGYVVIDVRGVAEVATTGQLSPSTWTLPLPEITEGCFLLSEEQFQEKYGFEKPAMDETLVFSCAAGIRARKAAEQALGVGYTKVVVYGGGANEWFA